MDSMYNIFAEYQTTPDDIEERLTNIYFDLPEGDDGDTIIALGALLYMNTRLEGGEPNEISGIAEELCENSYEHGVSTFRAYKLQQAFGRKIGLCDLSVMLHTLLKIATNDGTYDEELEDCVTDMADLIDETLTGVRYIYDPNAVAFALLCLSDKDETTMYNYAYDKLMAVMWSKGMCFWGYTKRDVEIALEILRYADSCVEDFKDEDGYIYQLIYRTVLIDALLQNDERSSGEYNDVTLTFEELGLDEMQEELELPDANEEDDSIDTMWDDFFIEEE